MTNDLEHRTKIRLDNIEDFMKDALTNASYSLLKREFRVLYNQNKALYEQNKIIIDYLNEIYKAQTGEQKW